MAEKDYAQGLKLREYLAELFSPRNQKFWGEKYGITAPPPLPGYGQFSATDMDMKFVTSGKPPKLTSIQVSGVTIPVNELPGYGQMIDADYNYTPGFLLGLLGAPAELNSIEQAKAIQQSIEYEEVPEILDDEIQAVGGGLQDSPNIGSPGIVADVSNISSTANETTLRNRQLTAKGDDPIEPLAPSALSEESVIGDLIGLGVDVTFIGLDTSGYPLGYKERQRGNDKYGAAPVYLPGMSSSFFENYSLAETYIGDLQKKLLDAGYLRGSFEDNVFDTPTEAAVIEAMGVHNKEGRIPNIPEVGGSLLDYLGLGDEGASKYAWDAERNAEVRDFFFAELDEDIQNASDRINDNVVTLIPEFQDETAGYLMLNTLQQNFGALGVKLENIRNPMQLVNSVLRDTTLDVKDMKELADQQSIDASKASINAAQDIARLRARNPNLSDEELGLMYPDLFADKEVAISAELGMFPDEEAVLNRSNMLFSNRLAQATERLIKPELDLLSNRQALDGRTRLMLNSGRGLQTLAAQAPTTTNVNA